MSLQLKLPWADTPTDDDRRAAEAPFECYTCGKRFKTAQARASHKAYTHDREKPAAARGAEGPDQRPGQQPGALIGQFFPQNDGSLDQ